MHKGEENKEAQIKHKVSTLNSIIVFEGSKLRS